MTSHLGVVKRYFVGNQAAEKYVGVFLLFVLEEKMYFFGQEFRVLLFLVHYSFYFSERLFDFLLLIRLKDVAYDEEKTFVGFTLLLGKLACWLALLGFVVGRDLQRRFRLDRTIRVRHYSTVSDCFIIIINLEL